MKQLTLVSLIIFLWLCGCSDSGKANQTPQAPKDGQITVADRQVLKEKISGLLDQANTLNDQGKYSEALVLIRQVVSIYGPFAEQAKFQYSVLDFQHFLLLKTGAYTEALENGFTLEALGQKIEERKSPWDCLKIADAYLGLKEYEKALDWIEKAVYEREFIRLDVFKNADYAPLKDNPRLIKILATIEKSIGIGLPAKDFTVTLLDGQPFTLSAQKGKVVLIDFWDVICPPCRKALPHLKKLHGQFAAKGLLIVGISLDTDKKLLDDYLKEIAVPWPMACSLKGWGDETAKLYKINATPSTWLIDRLGILRHINIKGEELEKAISELL